jgi:hypothetical protein
MKRHPAIADKRLAVLRPVSPFLISGRAPTGEAIGDSQAGMK